MGAGTVLNCKVIVLSLRTTSSHWDWQIAENLIKKTKSICWKVILKTSNGLSISIPHFYWEPHYRTKALNLSIVRLSQEYISQQMGQVLAGIRTSRNNPYKLLLTYIPRISRDLVWLLDRFVNLYLTCGASNSRDERITRGFQSKKDLEKTSSGQVCAIEFSYDFVNRSDTKGLSYFLMNICNGNKLLFIFFHGSMVWNKVSFDVYSSSMLHLFRIHRLWFCPCKQSKGLCLELLSFFASIMAFAYTVRNSKSMETVTLCWHIQISWFSGILLFLYPYLSLSVWILFIMKNTWKIP